MLQGNVYFYCRILCGRCYFRWIVHHLSGVSFGLCVVRDALSPTVQ